jgi:SlyX protein
MPTPAPAPVPSPATDSSAVAALEARIIELEIKLAFAEDNVETLSDILATHTLQIDRLIKAVAALEHSAAQGAEAARTQGEERPPHY